MNAAQIRGISYYLPKKELTNEELVASFSGWTTDKIEQKLGIAVRPIAGPDETAADMAYYAGELLLDSGICRREEIDFVILCTQSPDYFLPTSACILQKRLGLSTRCGAFDFNLGCSGYIYGLAICKGLVESGLAKNVLLLTSETYSKYINEQDRSSRPLFGDGATATLINCAATAKPNEQESWIGPFELGTDGNGADMLIVPAGAHRLPASPETAIVQPDGHGSYRSKNQLFMHGSGIFAFIIDIIPPLIERYKQYSRDNHFNIDYYIFHQANRYILERLRELCEIEESVYFNDMMARGNTVSSSIPTAIVDAMQQKKIKPGDNSLLVGFGVGLSWGACLVRFPEHFQAIIPK
ncbi:MAG: ketoacyl-ACP synthase III [Planctomycetia bacterium]|nr:ketoacyl-ACP synthase III [Planctomycetia bacterium]